MSANQQRQTQRQSGDFFLGLFALGLVGLALWWLRLVLLGLFGD